MQYSAAALLMRVPPLAERINGTAAPSSLFDGIATDKYKDEADDKMDNEDD